MVREEGRGVLNIKYTIFGEEGNMMMGYVWIAMVSIVVIVSFCIVVISSIHISSYYSTYISSLWSSFYELCSNHMYCINKSYSLFCKFNLKNWPRDSQMKVPILLSSKSFSTFYTECDGWTGRVDIDYRYRINSYRMISQDF